MSTGVWIDSDTGSLVTKEPVHGRVVVPVGDDIPEDIAAQLKTATKTQAKTSK